MSIDSQPFAYGAECRHRVLLGDECQRCKAEETPERVPLVGDDLTLVERIQAEAAACRLLDRPAAAARLDRIATYLAAREQALREEVEAMVDQWEATHLTGYCHSCDRLARGNRERIVADLRAALAEIGRPKATLAGGLMAALGSTESRDIVAAMLLDAADRLDDPQHRGNQYRWSKHAAMFRNLADTLFARGGAR